MNWDFGIMTINYADVTGKGVNIVVAAISMGCGGYRTGRCDIYPVLALILRSILPFAVTRGHSPPKQLSTFPIGANVSQHRSLVETTPTYHEMS